MSRNRSVRNVFMVRAGIFMVCMATSLAVIASFITRSDAGECAKEKLCVAFLDVGQGDAIYVRSPSGESMLVDGGKDVAALASLSTVVPYGDTNIGTIVATHYDADHIGGLAHAVDIYKPYRIIVSESDKETGVADTFNATLSKSGAQKINARAGQVYDLGSNVTVVVLYPFRDSDFLDTNDSSIVLLVHYGESDFLLTGDVPVLAELEMRRLYGDSLDAEVLKVGHHGSKTSSGKFFIDTVSPYASIISAGSNNRYGHPHDEVITNLSEVNSLILNTADNGTIIAETDGKVITMRRMGGLKRAP